MKKESIIEQITKDISRKYYTPDIDEFYVGFEFEISMQSHAMSVLDTSTTSIEQITPYIKSWEKTKVFFDYSCIFKNKLFRNIEQLKEILDDNRIRVKILDDQDIKKLSFKEDYKGFYIKQRENNVISINNDNTFVIIKVWYNTAEKNMCTAHNEKIFEGYVKNKSELKILLKQLNIE